MPAAASHKCRGRYLFTAISSPLLGVHGPQRGVVQAAPHRVLHVVENDGAHHLLAADLANLRAQAGGAEQACWRPGRMCRLSGTACKLRHAQLAWAAAMQQKQRQPKPYSIAIKCCTPLQSIAAPPHAQASLMEAKRTSSSLKKPKLTAATWAVVGFLLCSDDCMVPPPAAGQSRSTREGACGQAGSSSGSARRRRRWRRQHVGAVAPCPGCVLNTGVMCSTRDCQSRQGARRRDMPR